MVRSEEWAQGARLSHGLHRKVIRGGSPARFRNTCIRDRATCRPIPWLQLPSTEPPDVGRLLGAVCAGVFALNTVPTVPTVLRCGFFQTVVGADTGMVCYAESACTHAPPPTCALTLTLTHARSEADDGRRQGARARCALSEPGQDTAVRGRFVAARRAGQDVGPKKLPGTCQLCVMCAGLQTAIAHAQQA